MGTAPVDNQEVSEGLAIGGKDRGHGFSVLRNLKQDDFGFFMVFLSFPLCCYRWHSLLAMSSLARVSPNAWPLFHPALPGTCPHVGRSLPGHVCHSWLVSVALPWPSLLPPALTRGAEFQSRFAIR